MNINNILIIAAHPDDEILGCGGFIAKHKILGCNFKILFIGEGSTCRYDDYLAAEASSAVEIRNSHALRALNTLGVSDVVFKNLRCGALDQYPIIEINKIIEAEIADFNPDLVLTHSDVDINNDHRIVNRATLMATRPGAKNHIKRLMAYEVLSSTEWGFSNVFRPNYFENLEGEHLASKIKALNEYQTEVKDFPFPRSDEGVMTLAKIRGMQMGVRYSEAFSLIWEFRR